MVSNFSLVRCKCGNEQTVFTKCSQRIDCTKCNTLLAEPAGGSAIIIGKVVKNLD